jgi:hypothetical protein
VEAGSYRSDFKQDVLTSRGHDRGWILPSDIKVGLQAAGHQDQKDAQQDDKDEYFVLRVG